MELIDTYLPDHRITGRVIDRDAPVRVPDGEYVLAVHVLIFNEKGELLIQKRQETKKMFPGKWDLSAGGFVRSGEASLAAVLRETKEELGLSLAEGEVRYRMTISEACLLDDFYFAYPKDLELPQLRLQEEEVSAVRWVSESELLRMVDTGEMLDYNRDLMVFCMRLAGRS